jgi:hypothetical protein
MKKRLFALAIVFALPALAQAECYSEGVRVGTIQKFSQKGLLNKSWEGEMVMDGVKAHSSKNGVAVTNIWRFSVLRSDVAKKIDDAVFQGGTVAVKYCQSIFKNPLVQNTSYEVIDVAVRK